MTTSPLTAGRDRRRPQAVPRRLAAARAGPTTTRRSTTSSDANGSAATGWSSGARRTRRRPGTYFLATIDDEPLLIARGRDGELRAFYNVCRHRGTAVVEEPCGSAVRFQCPYHAWIYDLEGKLVRAKHTDDLDDFEMKDFGLVAVRMETWQGFVFVCLVAGDAAAHRLARRPAAASRPVRLRRAPCRAHGHVRGRHELEVRRRELQRVLPLPGHPPPAQQADAVRPRRRLRPDRAVAGRLDGARRRRRDDGRRRRPSRAAGRRSPGMTPVDERRIYYYLVWPTDVPVDPPGLPARPSARAGGPRPHADHLPVAVRARDDRGARLRPVRRDRVLGPDQPPGLARLRAAAARDAVAELAGRPLLEPGAERPRVRPDGGRPLRERRHQLAAHGPPALRRARRRRTATSRRSRARSRPCACRAPSNGVLGVAVRGRARQARRAAAQVAAAAPSATAAGRARR